MDWFIKLFTREEQIAGLEISDNYLRVALLSLGKEDKKSAKKSVAEVKFLAEEPLVKGVLVNGLIQDKGEFVKSVKKLIGRSPTKISMVMVSIPIDGIYSKIFSFPNTIVGEKLKESMDLTVGFQLPDKPEDIYVGWEKIESSDQNEILLTTIPKKRINEMVDTLGSAGLRVVAIELNALSVCRSMDIKDKEIVLVKAPQASSVDIFIIKNGLPYFMRALPEQFLLSEEELNKEVARIVQFFQSDKGNIDRNIDISKAKIIDGLSENPEIKKNNGKWLTSVGVAMRALTPRSEDKMISLMSIGTEDAYEYHKAVTFSEFVLEITTGISMLFVIVFLIALVFLSSAKQSIIKDISLVSVPQMPANANQLESQAQQLNNTLAITGPILSQTADWHTVISKLNADIVPGITVENISIPSLGGTISIGGTAETRDILNSFTSTLQADPFFSNVSVPITNVDQFTNLPFSASLNITNPQALYYAQ